MIEEEQKKEEGEGEPSKKKKIIGLVVKTVKYLVILSILGVGGYFGYTYFKGDENAYSSREFTHVKSNEAKLEFAFYNLREVYDGLIDIDEQIVLIDKEIERISTLETEYPDQKKITVKEKKNWNKIKNKLTKVLKKVELTLEAVFVTNSVNKENGKKLLEKSRNSLNKMIGDVLKLSKAQTSKIKIEKEKSIIDKILSIF